LNDKSFYTVRGYQILNSENKLLTPSMEDYLEMSYRIYKKESYIRIKELALKLNVKPASATKVIQKLKGLGLVDYEKYGIIKLTNEGKEIGHFLLKRHQIIDRFLKNLGIREKRLEDTEMIEHDISINTLRSIYIFNKFLEGNENIKEEYELFKSKISINIDLSYPK
jgi:Mn-dependent DtxR family transcriptional regulator